MERLNYNPAFSAYYKWQFIGNIVFSGVAYVTGAVLGALGIITEEAINVAILVTLGMALWAYVIGIAKMAKLWPTGEGQPFWWGGLKVTFLNFGLLGYRHEPVKNLPWKALFTWGLASVLVSPTLINQLAQGQVDLFAQTAMLSVMLVPVVIMAMYGIGKLFGLIFNR